MSSSNMKYVLLFKYMEVTCKKLKELRLEKKLRQVDMAKQMGFSQSTIAQWEKGTRQPTLDDIVLLAKFFNCSTDYLLGLSDN